MEEIGQKQSKSFDKDTCLVDEVRHQYEFVRAQYGESTWKCRFCGFLQYELEDSQP